MSAINLFPPPTPRPTPRPLNKPQQLALAVARAKAATVGAAAALKRAYDQVRGLVYASADYTADEFYAALGPEAAAQLKQFAVLTKTVINAAAPGTLVDDVPAATLTFPQEG